jgi:hypothetical protein
VLTKAKIYLAGPLDFSGKRATFNIETNTDDLIEVKELAEIAADVEYPDHNFQYLKVQDEVERTRDRDLEAGNLPHAD